MLRAAGPVKKPYKLAHSNVRGSKWIAPVDPLEKQKGIFLGGKHDLLLYNAITSLPLCLYIVLLIWLPVLWWVKYVSEIRTNLQDYFHEGNTSLQFLGYISFKTVLSWFFVTDLLRYDNIKILSLLNFPLALEKDDKINYLYFIPSTGIKNILLG